MNEKETHITVAVKHPRCAPRIQKIENTLEALQSIVEGNIDIVRNVTETFEIVCNDEFLYLEMPSNIYLSTHDMVLCGPLVLCAAEADEVDGVRFRSLTVKEQIEAIELLERGERRMAMARVLMA